MNKIISDRLNFFKDYFNSNIETYPPLVGDDLSLSTKFSKIEKNYIENNKEILIFKKMAIVSSVTMDIFEKIFKLNLYKKNISGEIYLYVISASFL